ncbi:MAG: tetratricopeptide repeat protein [Idiomarina sp.]|nr:tetratricopeptide repeat protein [Idiomarina sp.]
MSVINQVLRDLDKRQQNAQGARVRSHYQPANGRPWLWVGTLSAAIVVSAALTWWLVAHALTADEPGTAGSADSVYADNSFTQSAQAPLEPTQLAAEDDADTITEQPEVAVVQPHDVTVSAAPAEPAAAPRTSAQVEQITVQPVQVAPTSVPSHSGPSSTTTVEQTALSEHAPVQQAEEGQQSAPNQPNEAAQAEESRGEMSVQRVERSATELAAQRLDQAVGAMESGEGRKAESLLQEALVLAPQFVDARQQLAAYYYGRGFTSEALRVLREGLAHTPENSRLLTLSARIYEESGRADEALAMLNRIDADLPQQNDIVVLRAALANELGQYQIAADDYRQLLAVNPNQGIWWLGLGVAEEGRANLDAARLAYQRAGEDRSLDRASREYARSREEALTTW